MEDEDDNGELEPDNIDDLLLFRDENEDENDGDDESKDQDANENEGEAPTHEDAEEEFIEGVIYPNDARQTRGARRTDYLMLHRGR